MNRKTGWKQWVSAGLLVLCGIAVLAGVLLFADRAYLARLDKLDYAVYEQEQTPPGNPTKLVVCEKGIAVFYEDSGYAAVYSLRGEFRYGLKVDTSRNGAGNLDCIDGLWVFRSKNNSVYIFSGTELVERFPVTMDENLERGRELAGRMSGSKLLRAEYGGAQYTLEIDGPLSGHARIVRRDSAGGDETVVVLPGNPPVSILISVLGLACLLVLLGFTLRDRKKQS